MYVPKSPHGLDNEVLENTMSVILALFRLKVNKYPLMGIFFSIMFYY